LPGPTLKDAATLGRGLASRRAEQQEATKSMNNSAGECSLKMHRATTDGITSINPSEELRLSK